MNDATALFRRSRSVNSCAELRSQAISRVLFGKNFLMDLRRASR